jgi:FkbM family methyltransferase
VSSLRQLLTGGHFSRSELERHFRDSARSHYLGNNLTLARVLNKFTMLLPTGDRSVVPHLLMDGYWEMWLTLAVARHVQPGMLCVDVGANVGYYSLLLAELSGTLVHCVEPVVEAGRCIKESMKLSGFESFVVHEEVASDRLGTVEMLWAPSNLGGSRVVPHDKRLVMARSAKTERLDSIVQSTGAHFIKIDAEGSEARIWSGMTGLLCSPALTVMMEFDRTAIELLDGNGAAEQLLRRIQEDGFALRSVDPDGKIVTVTERQAMEPDTGTHRTLWLSRG